MADYIKNLKTEISKYLKTDNIYFHYKGRVSLYVILQAMNVKEGDEVIIPAYTCVVVPNPIIYLGAKPVYVDIDKDNLCMDINLLEKNITEKTKVIICQNTYGLSANVDTIVEIAKSIIYILSKIAHTVLVDFIKTNPMEVIAMPPFTQCNGTNLFRVA